MDEYELRGHPALLGYPVELPRIDQGNSAFLWVSSVLLAASVFSGTTANALPETAKIPSAVLEIPTNSGAISIRPRLSQQALLRPPASISLRTSVLLLHEISGLTWDQLGKLLGVSRRAMHLWSTGGRMNSFHAERLDRILTIIQGIEADTPSRRRDALLAPRPSGRTVYGELLAEVARPTGINRPALPPEQLVGALHDQPE